MALEGKMPHSFLKRLALEYLQAQWIVLKSDAVLIERKFIISTRTYLRTSKLYITRHNMSIVGDNIEDTMALLMFENDAKPDLHRVFDTGIAVRGS